MTGQILTATEVARRARHLFGDDELLGITTDAQWREVARIPAAKDAADAAAVICIRRMPAVAWRITGVGLDLSTVSDAGDLALVIAQAIGVGMFGPADLRGADTAAPTGWPRADPRRSPASQPMTATAGIDAAAGPRAGHSMGSEG